MLKNLIHNSETNCYKQYTNTSEDLTTELNKSLEEIEKFYYSDFWISRFKKRLRDVGFRYYPLELDCILGTISELKDNTKFKLFNENESSLGISDKGTMIALNINMKLLNDSHINNIVMHEFGHRQYNLTEFIIIKYLNKLIMKDNHVKDDNLSKRDLEYFTDDNELRQRIIPIIKEMYDNNWSAEEAYELSENLKIDDIKDIYDKEYIIYLLKNIL